LTGRTDNRPRIALVSREVWPFHEGGGLGRSVRAFASALAPVVDLTLVLPDSYRGKLPDDHPGLVEGVRYLFVRDPQEPDLERFSSFYHAWSALVCDALRQLAQADGLDLVEFPEYTGEGAVTVQARRSGDPALASTRIVVTSYGSDELHRMLNGASLEDAEAASIAALERIALHGADVLFLHAEGVRDTYEQLYADTGLAPAVISPPPFEAEADVQPRAGGDPRPLRLLHLGRMERRKGVEELVRAVGTIESDDLVLTLIGGDTMTGPGGGSMREHLDRIAVGDQRIEFRDQFSRPEVLAAIAEHDVMVVPSRWECFANTAREAIALGRPVLATPVGGLRQIVEDGVSGWFTAGTGADAIATGIELLLADRAAVDAMVGSAEVAAALTPRLRGGEAVSQLLEEARRDPSLAEGAPVRLGVTVIARDGGGSVAETLASLRRQTEPAAEVVVACQGRHAARGASAFAEAAGARIGAADACAGGELVAFLEAGTVLAPTYVERVGRAAAVDPDAACVTTWSNAAEPGVARPLGLSARLLDEDTGGELLAVRGDEAREALATLAPAELSGAGAWLLARTLFDRGRRGLVIPEELVLGRWDPGRAQPVARAAELNAALRRRALGLEPSTPLGPVLPPPPSDAAPLISVLMAARDADDTIRGSVESVLAQAEERLELIVIDDGSRVPLAELLGDVRDARLSILRHSRSRGVQAARNTGLVKARGPFIAQLDADDVWLPEYASAVLPEFEDPSVGLAYSNSRILGHPAGQELYIEDASVHPMDRFPKFAEQNPVPSLTATMRAEALRGVGGWRSWLRQAFDYDVYARLIMAGWRFAYVDRPLGWYRWPEPSRGMSYDQRRTEIGELQFWTSFVLRHPRVPGPRRQVRVRVGRELRRLIRR
jgi:glycogen synthase